MELNGVYFYTATILDWIPLLRTEKFKHIVLKSLIYLIKKGKIKVYGFVIMPNHIHLIWECLETNGKEMPHASFMKFTGHQFLEALREDSDELLRRFKTDHNSRNYQFWQRNSLPIKIADRKMLEQKLDYLHLNPLQKHWDLADDPNNYYFSSCSFYEQDDPKFNWLTHYMTIYE
ncbi:transposase [Mucilaginibacter sp. NFX135]|uniref:transposase n=1 Tax=Mucilaginibacter sp. NFX135 TaxID=3402687 RepID=UPI003AFA35BE